MKKFVPLSCSEKAFPLDLMFFALWMKISKTYYLSTQAAYKTDFIISEDETFIYHSAKNKDFSWTLLQRLLKQPGPVMTWDYINDNVFFFFFSFSHF